MGKFSTFLTFLYIFRICLLNNRMLGLPRSPRSLIIGLQNCSTLWENSKFYLKFLLLLMSIIILFGLLVKPPTRIWKDYLGIFSGLLVFIIMAFTELLGIFVVSRNNLVALAYFPHRNKVFLFVPNVLFMPSLEMKLGILWFGIAFPLGFLSLNS